MVEFIGLSIPSKLPGVKHEGDMGDDNLTFEVITEPKPNSKETERPKNAVDTLYILSEKFSGNLNANAIYLGAELLNRNEPANPIHGGNVKFFNDQNKEKYFCRAFMIVKASWTKPAQKKEGPITYTGYIITAGANYYKEPNRAPVIWRSNVSKPPAGQFHAEQFCMTRLSALIGEIKTKAQGQSAISMVGYLHFKGSGQGPKKKAKNLCGACFIFGEKTFGKTTNDYFVNTDGAVSLTFQMQPDG